MKNYLLLILFVFTNILFAQNPGDIDIPFTGTSQPDGKTIIGGNFTTFDGSGSPVTAFRLIRLNDDGTLDIIFNNNINNNITSPGFNGLIKSIALQSDGKILVGGNFTSFNGMTQRRLVRLNDNGTLDTSFNIGSGFKTSNDPLFDTTAILNTIVLQSDGKILVGGIFSIFNATALPTGHKNMVRLNDDGTLSASFANTNQIFSILIHNNQILIGGANDPKLKRLNMDGSVDADFTPPFFGSSVSTIAIQNDGKILVGGSFESIDIDGYFTGIPATSQNRLVRLNNDGSKDDDFIIGNGFTNTDPLNLNPRVITIQIQEVQGEWKILVGGQFTTFNNETNNNLIRLNNDGSKDITFDTNSGFNTNEKVNVIKTQPSGKVFIGGTFNNYQGTNSNKLIRLKGATATLTSDTFTSSDIKVSLYPNPTTDYLNISTSQDITSYDIYDINGRNVLSNKTSDKTVSVSSLSNGMYIIAIKTDSGVTSSKFIKK